jgi:cytochrome P450 family 142 subfamily A polypeptide 1
MSFEGIDLNEIHVHGLSAEPLYEWLRERAPLFRDAKDLWAVSRYDDVAYVSKHPEIFSSRYGVVPGVNLEMWPDEAMINMDGDEHTCQRGLVSKGFTPGRIAALEPAIRAIMTELIDRVAPRGQCDLVSALARPLPMRVIGDMLGYPVERNDELLDITDVVVLGGNGPEHVTEEVAGEFMKFCSFHEELLAQRKEQRGNDLISLWLDAELDGKKLSEDKLLYEHNLLLVGGSETTRHAISGGMYQILRRPADVAYLREHPEAIPGAVEEMVRFTTPFVRMQRTLVADHAMHGITMKAGDHLIMVYPAANRDPRAFERPQEFDVRRRFDKPALAFGLGKHYCLGASLARLEIRVFLEEVLRRFGDITIDPGYEAAVKPSSFVRGLSCLPVHFRAAG